MADLANLARNADETKRDANAHRSRSDNFAQIAELAEKNVNTYQRKTGEACPQGLDEGAGVNSMAEQEFPGAKVTQGEDLTLEAYGTRHPHKEARERRQQAAEESATAHSTRDTGLGSANDIATQGKAAERNNVGASPPGVGGSQFKGENYYDPESVPESISAEGWVAPESATQASRETEGYGK